MLVELDLPVAKGLFPRTGRVGEAFRSSYHPKTFSQSDLPELITFSTINDLYRVDSYWSLWLFK